MNETDLIIRILRRNERLKNERSSWEALWNRSLEFCAPQHGVGSRDTKPISGEKRGIKAYDGTPEWAKDVMVAGLYSGMTPDNYKYFRWMFFPLALNTNAQFRKWAEECENIAYQFLNASNYGDTTYTAFEHQTVYGTAVKYSEADVNKRLTFMNISLFDCVLSEDRHGIVDTVFREFKWSARNAEKEWGDKVPDTIKRAIESGNPDDEFDFLHAVLPREDYDPSKRDKKNMPWASLWIYPSLKLLLDEGGYREFPYSVPRMYKQRGEIYGRGPAIKALQSMSMLNEMEITNLLAGQRIVEPAIQYPADGFSSPIDLGTGALNPYTGPPGGRVEPINVGLNVPFGIEMEDRQEKAVGRYFHTDVFLAITNAETTMTATEALERKQEKLVLMGPAVGRQKREHLDSDLDRIFSILLEGGQLPPPPEELLMQMERMDTEYVSPLFLAQRRRDSESVMKVYQAASLIAQSTGRGDVLDRLDDDAAIKLIAEREVVPSEIMRDDESVERIRQMRLQQKQAMEQAQAGIAAVEAAKSLGQTPMDPRNPNAATEIMKGMGGNSA